MVVLILTLFVFTAICRIEELEWCIGRAERLIVSD